MEEILHRFSSATLGNERTIWIREAPDPSQPFHLAIFLDAELYRDRVGAVAIIKHLQSTARLANTLFGFVSMESVESRWKECPCHAPFADFLNGELVPWLEERYPPLTTASERVLIGLSYTGLAALFVASSPHSTFNRVIAQSGSFWWNHCFLTENSAPPIARCPRKFISTSRRKKRRPTSFTKKMCSKSSRNWTPSDSSGTF